MTSTKDVVSKELILDKGLCDNIGQTFCAEVLILDP